MQQYGAYVPGLSPRGRGNPAGVHPAGRPRGSIPAWAGEPAWAGSTPSGRRVYPRVGGGTASCARTHDSRLLGSIPAWAGEPGSPRRGNTFGRVYPRVGGGTSITAAGVATLQGLSPRGRGNRSGPALMSSASGAVYPRVGGGTTVASPVRADVRPGSIPAWAGEPGSAPRRSATRRTVYPRVGGGTRGPTGPADCPMSQGLSPRGRGNRSLIVAIRASRSGVYPRVGGGTMKPVVAPARGEGSIPAWAGEPTRASRTAGRSRVYPRVGGGTTVGRAGCRCSRGLSPRGRGNRRVRCGPGRRFGSIPAWAGEPMSYDDEVSSNSHRVYPRVGGGTKFARHRS